MKKNIDLNEIDKLCNMSQLQFSDEDKKSLLLEVISITELLDKMNDVDEESSFLATQKLSDLRNDIPLESMDMDEVFLNAKNRSGDYFSVPKVVD